MPSDLGNLLIRVSADGFDQVLQNLQNLEAALQRIGNQTGLSGVSDQLEQMLRMMRDMHGYLGELTIQHERQTSAQQRSAQQAQDTGEKFTKLDKVFGTLTKTVALFWAVVAVPRKFLNGMEQIAAFNLSLTNMAINANTARSTLVTLGTAVEGLGGSRQGLASTMSRFQSMTTGMRMGRGGGALEDVATTYGLDIRGSNGGLATPTEILRNIAKLFESGNLSQWQKLDIKNQLGLDDGTFALLSKGVKAFDAELAKAAQHEKEMAGATEASRRINEQKAKLDQAWADAQARMLKVSEPLIDDFIKLGIWVADLSKKCPELSVGAKMVIETCTGMASAYALFKGLQKHLGRGIPARVPGAPSPSPGAPAPRAPSPSPGGMAAGGGIAGADLGAMQAGGVVSDTIFNVGKLKIGNQQHQTTVTALRDLTETVRVWHTEWFMKSYGTRWVANVEKVGGDFRELTDFALKGSYGKDEIIDELLENAKRTDGDGSKAGGCAVSISNITINVSSTSANAEEVARAVREELYSQINRSVDEAMRGVKVL